MPVSALFCRLRDPFQKLRPEDLGDLIFVATHGWSRRGNFTHLVTLDPPLFLGVVKGNEERERQDATHPNC